VRRLKAGGINLRPQIRVTKTAPATAMVDGDNGMGHLVMSRAANEAIAITREAGVSWVGVWRSNHAARKRGSRFTTLCRSVHPLDAGASLKLSALHCRPTSAKFGRASRLEYRSNL
jgi:hypothetical protein